MTLMEICLEVVDWIHLAHDGSELSGSVQAWEFFGQLSDCQILRDCVPIEP